MSERRWFVLGQAGDRSGPKTTTEIIRALLDERVSADTKLCAEGSDSWQEARSIDEFRIVTKAVRATVQRRMSSRPPPGYVKAALDEDDDDVKTRYFSPGAEPSRAGPPSRTASEDDEEEVRTRYFQPTAAQASLSAQTAPKAGPPRPPSPQASAPRAAPPAVARARPAPRPPVVAPPVAARPAAPVPSAVSAALQHGDDDEDEIKTQYFQPGERESMRRAAPASSATAEDDDEDEVKTKYFQPGAGASKPARMPAVAPPAQAAAPAARPMAPLAATAPAAPAPPVPGQQPRAFGPQSTQIGAHAMTVMMPAVRTRKTSAVLIVAGLAAFLIALLIASAVAWFVMMGH